MEFKKSEFFRLIDFAITSDSTNLIKELYELDGIIDENLNLVYTDDFESLEKAVRFLTKCEILFKCLNQKILISDVPEDKADEIIWFVKFFAYLESEISNWEIGEDDFIYNPNKNHLSVFYSPFCQLDIKVEDMKFLLDDLQVEILVAEN